MTYDDISHVPKDRTVVDDEGFTWTYRHGAWGFRWKQPDSRWRVSHIVASGRLAPYYWGPFKEVAK